MYWRKALWALAVMSQYCTETAEPHPAPDKPQKKVKAMHGTFKLPSPGQSSSSNCTIPIRDKSFLSAASLLRAQEGLPLNATLKSKKMDERPCIESRVAILLVGHSSATKFGMHLDPIYDNIVAPLRAGIFSVFDLEGPDVLCGKPLREVLPLVFGRSVKAVGLVADPESADSQAEVERLSEKYKTAGTTFHLVPNAIQTVEHQWYKLHAAWILMHGYENSTGISFDVVVKLRFDCTPLPRWNICQFSDAMAGPASGTSSTLRAIHACTDHVFWGRRDVMEVAAGMHQRIFLYYKKTNPIKRKIMVGAMLGSLLAMPEEKWAKPIVNSKTSNTVWKYFNKVGTLPYLPGSKGTNVAHPDDYHTMVNNMVAAYNRGVSAVDPTKKNSPLLLAGTQSGKHDYKDNTFASEKDFLAHMIASNVTVPLNIALP